jgi:hypothetical protein
MDLGICKKEVSSLAGSLMVFTGRGAVAIVALEEDGARKGEFVATPSTGDLVIYWLCTADEIR